MILPDDKTRLQELIKKTNHLWKFLDCDAKKTNSFRIRGNYVFPHFWDDQTEAKRVSSEANRLKQTVEKIESFRVQVDDLDALAELCDEDENDQEMETEFISTLEELLSKVEDLEVASFLGEPFDDRPALLSIHAGAGGTESCDWADMLMRMYMRWAERRGFKVELQDLATRRRSGGQSVLNSNGGFTCIRIRKGGTRGSSIGSN